MTKSRGGHCLTQDLYTGINLRNTPVNFIILLKLTFYILSLNMLKVPHNIPDFCCSQTMRLVVIQVLDFAKPTATPSMLSTAAGQV